MIEFEKGIRKAGKYGESLEDIYGLIKQGRNGNRGSASVYVREKCQGYLWNKEEKKYEYIETLPINFDYIDEENHRITYHTSGGVSEDNYYIYEYVEGEFGKKYLQLRLEEERVVWKYYEDDKVLEELQLFLEEGEKRTYLFQNFQTGQLEKGTWEGRDGEYYKLGKIFFPEFDFYYLG